MSAQSIRIDLPEDRWLSLNREVPNHGYRRTLVARVHESAGAAASRQGLTPIRRPVVAEWTVHYPKGVGAKADPVDAAPTTKAILEALVDRGALVGDDCRYVVKESFERGENLDRRGVHMVVLVLREVAA